MFHFRANSSTRVRSYEQAAVITAWQTSRSASACKFDENADPTMPIRTRSMPSPPAGEKASSIPQRERPVKPALRKGGHSAEAVPHEWRAGEEWIKASK